MRVYICDDNELDRERVSRMLGRYARRFPVRLIIRKFQSAAEMLRTMEKGRPKPDLILMDIYMEEMDGLQAGEKLRSMFGTQIPVIFSTSSDAHAISAFKLRAAGYLQKPYTQQEFDHAMKRVERLFVEDGRYLEVWLSEEGRTVRIYFPDIIYVNAEGRRTVFHLCRISTEAGKLKEENCTVSCGFPIKKYREELEKDEGFFACGKSCAVNLAHVVSAGEDLLMSNGDRVPVPRRLVEQASLRIEEWKKHAGDLRL